MFDSTGLQILPVAQCHALLASAGLGRIVFTDRAMPAIQPVRFVMHDGSVFIRTSGGSKLAAAASNAVVAFEADSFASDLNSGWAVAILGHATEVRGTAELGELARLDLLPWEPTETDHVIKISIEVISGRRLLAALANGSVRQPSWDAPVTP